MTAYSTLRNYFTTCPATVSIRNFRYYLVAHIAYNFAITVHLLWLIYFFIIDVKPLFYFNCFSVPFFLFCILINRKGYHLLTTTTAMLEIVSHQLIATYLLGSGSGFQYYLLVVAIFPFVMPKWPLPVKIFIFLFPLASYMIIEFYFNFHVIPLKTDPINLAILKSTNLLFSFFCLGILGAHFNYAGSKTEEELDLLIKTNESLLNNILPVETALELKTTGFAKARGFNEVTVLFTDFKNFTLMSELLSAQELVNEINYFYSAFDSIITKHNVEKIKTIGDSYMCAGGLPVANKTNAEDTMRAALEIRDFMIKEKEARERIGKNCFEIRIGCNTGPVVAGIVGINKFAYDIWGDTVNIASRMESSGVAGKVNISGTTYELIKDKFTCTYRGKIKAKNKGEIDMYFAEAIS